MTGATPPLGYIFHTNGMAYVMSGEAPMIAVKGAESLVEIITNAESMHRLGQRGL